MTELKNCPFCNGEVSVAKKVTKPRFFVYCSACKVRGPQTRSKETAMEKWNNGQI